MPLEIGQTLRERYRIDALLGRGGMGAVYRAYDLNLNIAVVVKENLIHSDEARRQFGREARILASLRHPNLPRVTDFFFLPGQGQYLVMDFVEGEDLKRLLARQGACPEAIAIAWMHPVLDALEYLHNQSIIHRDVKPANIKLTPRGEIALVDFGLAKVYDPAQETTVGARGVTPGYAPPEQYGQGRTDARSDIYSLGATLYALLTGKAPPDGLALVIAQEKLVPPRQLRAEISEAVEQAILRAMQSRPDDRFQTAAAFRAALPETAAVQEAVEETRPKEAATPSKPAPRPEPTSIQAAGGPQVQTDDRPIAGTAEADQPPSGLPPTRVVKLPTPKADELPPTRVVKPPTPQAVAQPVPSKKGRTPLPSWFWLAVAAAVTLLVVVGLLVALLLSGGEEPTIVEGGARLQAGTLFMSNREGNLEIYGFAAGELVRLTSKADRGESWSPVAEPDGDILYTSNQDGKREVYRLGADGPVRVTFTPGHGESWSPFPEPDGDILFTSSRDGKREIYRLSADGTARVTYTPEPGESWAPVAEPDGDLVFTSDRDGKREIYRLSSEGLTRVTYTPSHWESWAPFPEPDGDILFTSDRDGKPEIYRLSSKGVARVTHTAGEGGSWSPRAEPDGDILFTSNRDGKLEIYRLGSDGTVRVTRTEGGAESWWDR